jgi:hypothetical protein
VGCDIGAHDDRGPGPDLHALAAYPKPGQGTECAPPEDCGVSVHTAIELRFDRYVLPSTAVRQSIQVFSGDEGNAMTFEPFYDVVERVVVYRLREGVQYQPGTLYTVRLRRPNKPGDFGFRAFDGAPLAEDSVPLTYNFVTSRTVDSAPVDAQQTPNCGDIVNMFRTCSLSCHVTNSAPACGQAPSAPADVDPPMQLWLHSPDALSATAIGHVAKQTEVGPRTGVVLQNPLRFGVQMPRIDPGQPGNSYLLYKLLRKPENFSECAVNQPVPLLPNARRGELFLGARCGTLTESERLCLSDPCGSCYSVELPPGECIVAPVAERERLHEWFSKGEPMPLDALDATCQFVQRNLTKLDLRVLQRWIADGAQCP